MLEKILKGSGWTQGFIFELICWFLEKTGILHWILMGGEKNEIDLVR